MAFAIAMAFGFATGEPAFKPESAFAACGTAFGCFPDFTATSAIEVNHVTDDLARTRVEPDDSETWEIEAFWATIAGVQCSCLEHAASVTASVPWTGSASSV